MTEVWKQIPDFSGRYEVSDLGQVRSWVGRNGSYVRETPLILKTKRPANISPMRALIYARNPVWLLPVLFIFWFWKFLLVRGLAKLTKRVI